MMNGEGPIVIRLGQGQQFFEHDTIQSAGREAHRLAAKVSGQFVVYVPVMLVEFARTTQKPLWSPDEIDHGTRHPF